MSVFRVERNKGYRYGEKPIFEAEQRTYRVCFRLHEREHHQNPQYQAIFESSAFQCT